MVFQTDRHVPLGEIPVGAKRGWQLVINGQLIEEVSSLYLFNERFGLFKYGWNPAGYDAMGFHEIGGGGAVTVPYTIDDGNLYVGVVLEDRIFQGGMVQNVPRGFLDAGERHFQTALRETMEEVGFQPEQRLYRLNGQNVNPNSTFFVTTGEGEGVKFHAFHVSRRELEFMDTRFQFNSRVLTPLSKGAQKIFQSLFMHWQEAMELADGFTRGIVGTLISRLAIQGVCKVSFKSE